VAMQFQLINFTVLHATIFGIIAVCAQMYILAHHVNNHI